MNKKYFHRYIESIIDFLILTFPLCALLAFFIYYHGLIYAVIVPFSFAILMTPVFAVLALIRRCDRKEDMKK